MYTTITKPGAIVYDYQTNQPIGNAKFYFTPASEQDMLNLLNYNEAPRTLQLLDVDVFPVPEGFRVLNPYASAQINKWVIHAILQTSDTGEEVPVEIGILFKPVVRSITPQNPNQFDSVDLNDVQVESVREQPADT